MKKHAQPPKAQRPPEPQPGEEAQPAEVGQPAEEIQPAGQLQPAEDAPSSPLSSAYKKVLGDFLRSQSEKALYDASELSKMFIERGVGPEEIVAIHTEILEEAIRALPLIEKPRAMTTSLQFLLEVMIAYGISYKEYLDLKLTEATRAIERQLEVDRIRAREEIRRQQDVLQAKEEFLEFVTHELRNPLATLMGSIEYMLGGLGRNDPERRERLLQRMKEAVAQLVRMVNDLLTASRAEAVESALKLEPLDLDAAVHWVVSTLSQEAATRGVDLAAHLAAGDARILGDREWLGHSLSNVVATAIGTTSPGGKVWVNTRGGRPLVTIEVGSTGPGIPAEQLPQLFQRFRQAGEGEGIGIGLHLAQRMIERHGGKITAKNEEGQGTTFCVALPAI